MEVAAAFEKKKSEEFLSVDGKQMVEIQRKQPFPELDGLWVREEEIILSLQ